MNAKDVTLLVEAPNLPAIKEILQPSGISHKDTLAHSQATTSTNRKFVLPMEFMPPIKAKPRNLKRHRVPGKRMIATDTPENN